MLRKLWIAGLVFLCACPSPGSEQAEVSSTPTLPDSSRPLVSLIRKHARQFDEELPDRPAGSQEELAAATYIVGHLQLAGYRVTFDDVPVENLVESSNVIALPPGGETPRLIVSVAYDAEEGERSGYSLGVFLEVARALILGNEDHRIAFVALTAETTGPDLGAGSRALASSLREQGTRPGLVGVAASEDRFGYLLIDGEGRISRLLGQTANDSGWPIEFVGHPAGLHPDPLRKVGIDTVTLGGPYDEVAKILMKFLVRFGD